MVIPIIVIEEIDRFKHSMTENGRSARTFSRLIDGLRKQGALNKGVTLPNGGGLLRVEMTNVSALGPGFDVSKADNQMLSVAANLQEEHPDHQTKLISKDINLRIKADAFGIQAQDYQLKQFSGQMDQEGDDQLFSGISTQLVPGESIDTLFLEKKLTLPKIQLFPNQFVVLKDESNPTHTAIGRFDKEEDAIVPVHKFVKGLWGIFPRNVEQTFAVDLLLNDKIKLVSLVGKAGTGKTLLTLAAGLSKTVDDNIYNRLLVSRPVMPLGKDIGFLPGTVEEKLHPYMQPVFDNIDFLLGSSSVTKNRRRGSIDRGCQELVDQGILNIEPLTYIRGRSIPQQFMIIDEAQNLSPHEMKTIITRAGERTKIVITGDTLQIDSPYLDEASNGLSYVVERFKNEAIAGSVILTKGERSELSELATHLM